MTTTPVPGASARRSRLRRTGWVVPLTVLGLLAGLLGPAPSADAAPGPAPAPVTTTVLAKVHTDAISTFLDQGNEFVLGSRADAPESGTRYDPAQVWFHVDDASRSVVPSGFEFIGAAGSEVWIAPESNPGGQQLWPGFSTEGVPAGAIAGNTTTFTLTGVRAPEGGSVEVYTGGGSTPVTRRWSSDEDRKTFTLGRTHSHANWAFTRAGTYELDVRASATLAGTPVADAATYTFVVGPLPEQVSTTTTVDVHGGTEVAQGTEIELHATVEPATVTGAVEFRRSGTVIGHQSVTNGEAELSVSDLPVGTHQITAHFVPETTNLATGSASDAVTVTVTDGSGAELAVTGVEESYDVGDVLEAGVAGYALAEGESWAWFVRPVGNDWEYGAFSGEGDQAAAGQVRQALDMGLDGYELQARVATGPYQFTGVETPWVAINVEPSAAPMSATYPEGFWYFGDVVQMELSRPLTEGETARLVARLPYNPPGAVYWYFPGVEWRTSLQSRTDGTTVSWQVENAQVAHTVDFAVQVVRDGVVVASAEPVTRIIHPVDVEVEGLRGVYRPGQTVSLAAVIDPPRDGMTYRWSNDGGEVVKEGTGPGALTYESVVADESFELRFEVLAPDGDGGFVTAGRWSGSVNVSDADPDEQIFTMDPLGGHLHQGDRVTLRLAADPEPTEDDEVIWEWLWPGEGQEWLPVPGAAGLAHRIVAEQALDGVQFRATLDFAGEETESMVAGPVTVPIDDHGAPANQRPTVAGSTTYDQGDALALTRELPANGATILTTHRWERQAAGSSEWTVVDGQTAAELTTPVTVADDGASYRVSILKPNGEVAYGPSPGATVSVEPAEPAGPSISVAPLADHYHSGERVTLTVVGEPELPASEFVLWQWSFPGSEEWLYLPGDICCGHVLELPAEQGLDGVQMRATTPYREDGPLESAPVTVHVDDHGTPSPHVLTVGGPAAFVEGQTLALSRAFPAGVSTVLPEHRWERRASGSTEWTVVAGETGEEMTVAATRADDGAAYRVSVLTPAGQVAYGPSALVTVSVTPETATGFGLAGVQSSYAIGEVLRARVLGRDRTEGQTWRFFIRTAGSTGAGNTFYGDGYSFGDDEYAAWDAGRVRQTLDAGFDGYEIRARLRENGVYVAGADTAWVPLEIRTTARPLTFTFPQGPHFSAADIAIPFEADLGEGEEVRLVHRTPGGLWSEAYYQSVEGGVLTYVEPYPSGSATEYALQIERDGLAIFVTAPVTRTIFEREARVSGVQGVYRVGQTLSATAEIYPPMPGLTYSWYLIDADYNSTLLEEGTGAEALSIEIADLGVDLDGATLQFQTELAHPVHGTLYPAFWETELRVSDAAPDEQLLFFKSLSGHYHQGYEVDLELVADPALAAGDTVRWEWRWPGEDQDWIPFEGPSGLTHSLVAEQALDGVQVRATVDFAKEGVDPMAAETTIHHDDHGGVARQQPTVGGATSYVDGEPLALSLELPEDGATVLTTHRWERQAAGSTEWAVVDGESGAELSVPARLADDGASYRVSILKPNGEVAYGPSPPVTLVVEEAPDEVDPPSKVASTVKVGKVGKVKAGKWASIPVRVTAPRASGAPVTGWVRVRVAGIQRVKKLVDGRATIKVRMRPRARPGAKRAWVMYQGNAALTASRTSFKVVVVR